MTPRADRDVRRRRRDIAAIEQMAGLARRTLAKSEDWRLKRDKAIVEGVRHGLTLQEASDAADMSRSNVAKMVRADRIARGEIESC